MSRDEYTDAEITLFSSLRTAMVMAENGSHDDAAQAALAGINFYHRHDGE